ARAWIWLIAVADVVTSAPAEWAHALRDQRAGKVHGRGVHWTRWIEDVAQDVRYGIRLLTAKPGFAVAAVVTLALGIGATTVMFGVVDALFLSPPPGVREADELVRIYIARDEGSIRTPGGGSGSYPDYVALHENAQGFEDIAAIGRPKPIDLGLGPDAQRITGQVVSENFFALLGIRPARGRLFVAADAAGAASPVVVVAHRFWRSYLGETAEVVGRTLVLNGTTATIIGVAPQRFSGIEPQPVDVWVPAMKAAAVRLGSEGWLTHSLAVVVDYVGRLSRDASTEVAQASTEATLRHAAEQVPELDPDPRVILAPFITARGPKRSDPASVALWVALATGLLLLTACANVANLLLARAASRRREIGVRLSLGVSRARLTRQLLTESLLLAALGCVSGLVLAFAGAELVQQFPLPSAGRFDGRMVAFAVSATVVTGVLFGFAPALQALRTDTVAGLKDAASSHSRGHARLRDALVAAQAALALVTLVGAGLFVRSLSSALSIDPGIALEHVTMLSADLENAGYTRVERATFWARARERLLSMPGVEGVTTALIIPFSGSGHLEEVDPPGADSILSGEDKPFSNWVAPGFARAMGIQVIAGRDITEADDRGAPPVALVSAELARLIVPGGDVVGSCVPIGRQHHEGGCTRIVGVVESIRHTLLDEPAPYLFLSWAQHEDEQPWDPQRLFVRTSGDPEWSARQMRAAVQGLAADLPFVSVEPISNLVQRDLLPLRIGATLSSLFGVLALVLAAIGLYGVLGYFVAERTSEIGIRRSLGAQEMDVIGLVLQQALLPVAIGATVGVAAALAGGGLLEALLFGVPARDAVTLVTVVFFLGAVALVASYLPARRAAAVNPRIALREE
ncbi:MAG: ABC transporter permease, partial [Longimicrobiales bacterium]